MKKLISIYDIKIIFSNRLFLTLSIIIVAISLLFAGHSIKTSAESYPSGSDNGSTSLILGLSNTLSTDGYGSTTNTPNYGSLWNRIITSAEWTPSGNATASEVLSGNTFYSNSRTQSTGTYPAPGPCPTELYYDPYGNPVTQTSNCTANITWALPNGSPAGSNNYDPVTGLIWSEDLVNNSGTLAFSTSSGSTWSWDSSGSNNAAVGNLTAAQLCTAMGGSWRLPTQKEFMQAYIDGSHFNLTGGAPVYAPYWTKTTYSSNNAVSAYLDYGSTFPLAYSTLNYIRCVH
jgi:hypothetical protein